MPTRVLLEGAALEPLLAQVRQEYGPTARIVSAEKVRSGGLGGFFARQRYELAVEIDDVTTEPDGAPEAGGVAGAGDAGAAPVDNLLALVEASQDRYRDLAAPAEPTAPARKPRRSGARSGGAQPRPWIAPELPAAAPARAAAQDGVQAARAAAQTAAQAAQAALAAQETQTGAQAARPGAQETQTGAQAAQPAAQAAQTAVPARAGLVSTTGAAFAEVMAGLQGGLTPAPDETPAPILVPHRRPDDGGIPRSAPEDSAAGQAAGARAAGAAAREGTATPGPCPDTDTDTDTGTGRSWAAELVALGMPEHLAERAAGDDPYQAIMLALGDLPVPPAAPDQRGDVLTIAGELALAMPVAEKAARDLHLDPTKIMVAGPTTAGTGLHASRRISGPAEAQRRARKLHHEEVPHVVVVDVAMPAGADGWAREVCDALGATAVWAIVDATRKTADVARHLRALGDVDGVVVHGLAATGDPASVLALPAPVVSLDGQPATARAWAALLSERLAPAERPAPRGRRGRRGRS